MIGLRVHPPLTRAHQECRQCPIRRSRILFTNTTRTSHRMGGGRCDAQGSAQQTPCGLPEGTARPAGRCHGCAHLGSTFIWRHHHEDTMHCSELAWCGGRMRHASGGRDGRAGTDRSTGHFEQHGMQHHVLLVERLPHRWPKFLGHDTGALLRQVCAGNMRRAADHRPRAHIPEQRQRWRLLRGCSAQPRVRCLHMVPFD